MPVAGDKRGEEKISDAHPDEAQRGMADGGGHAAHLAIFPFGELEGEPAIGDSLAKADRWTTRGECGRRIEEACATRQGLEISEVDLAALEARERDGSGNALDLCPILPTVSMLGIKEAGVEAGFVAEEEETLTVGVEPAERINVFGQTEVCEGAPLRAGLGCKLREDAVRFVEGEEHRALRTWWHYAP